MDRGAWLTTVHGSQRVGHDQATSLHFTRHTHELTGKHKWTQIPENQIYGYHRGR